MANGHKGNGELGKSLNTDEAAAMGAVYKAADLSTGFKVRKAGLVNTYVGKNRYTR